jgi:cyclopropane-fatty-acyl-phospholipid synthase
MGISSERKVTLKEPRPVAYMHEQASRNKTIRSCRDILRIIFNNYQGPVAIRLWNDEIVIGKEKAAFTLIFREAYPLKELLFSSNLNRLAEAHLYGDVDGEGDLEKVFDLIDYLQDRKFSLVERIKIFRLASVIKDTNKTFESSRKKSRRNSNSKESISHHYDVHNDFYSLFLDPEMVYSCAYFSSEDQSLADAQSDKLDYICRKLRLKAGQKLLDIGCGWGGLACWAARHYGVEVHGITLSQEQYNYAVTKCEKLGLDNQVKFELRDYRDLGDDEQYDRIVSVGMFEHIGIENFPVYFSTVWRLLKSDGLFLNHGITNDTGWHDTLTTRFINEYIFPDGELARVSDVTAAMENESLEILDTEALRPHYAMTLRHWVRKLEWNKKQAIDIAGEATYRLWLLYMAGSAHYFSEGSTGLYQILACKSRQPWFLPLRREDLYRE